MKVSSFEKKLFIQIVDGTSIDSAGLTIAGIRMVIITCNIQTKNVMSIVR
jgi:hypothetical protein